MMRTFLRSSLCLVLIGLGVPGCGEEPNHAAERSEAEQRPLPPAAKPSPQVQKPAVTAGSAERGQTPYLTYCATCHGASGKGDGPISETLDPVPARHSDGTYMGALSDEHLFEVIKRGGPAVGLSPIMPGWGGALTDDQIRDVIAFIRTLAD